MDYFIQYCELSNLHVFLSLERYMGLEYKAYYIVVCQLHFSLLIKFFKLNERYYCHIAIHNLCSTFLCFLEFILSVFKACKMAK